tara:strand:+ start:2539 stop:2994 length:456 start_codon:yes stop_codon:yes gene_type:complete
MKITNKRKFTGFDSNHPKKTNKNGLEFLSDVVINFNTCNQQKNPKKRIVNIRWRNMVKDKPIRNNMKERITQILKDKKKVENDNFKKKLPNMVKNLESHLYFLSSSKEKYLEENDLEFKIHKIVLMWRRNIEAQKYRQPRKYVPIKKKPKK